MALSRIKQAEGIERWKTQNDFYSDMRHSLVSQGHVKTQQDSPKGAE